MSSRIAETFERCRAEGRAALVGYLTACDPDRDRSLELMVAASDRCDVLELGVPFSDPTADGPAIQAAMERALRAGGTLEGILGLAAELRRRTSTPIVLFSYANPLLRMGAGVVAERAAAAGIDGLLVVDVPPEHAAGLRDPVRAAGLDWIPLCAPTTTADRRARIAESASGFVYLVSLRGVTGRTVRADDPELAHNVAELRRVCSLPVAVGFGVRTPEQAAVLAAVADGVVVGSALVEAGQGGPGAVRELVAGLAGAMGRPARAAR